MLICKWIYTLASRSSLASIMILIRLNKNNVPDLQLYKQMHGS